MALNLLSKKILQPSKFAGEAALKKKQKKKINRLIKGSFDFDNDLHGQLNFLKWDPRLFGNGNGLRGKSYAQHCKKLHRH